MPIGATNEMVVASDLGCQPETPNGKRWGSSLAQPAVEDFKVPVPNPGSRLDQGRNDRGGVNNFALNRFALRSQISEGNYTVLTEISISVEPAQLQNVNLAVIS